MRTGREAMACRLAVVASSREAASAALARYLAAGADEDLSAGGVFATGRPGAAAGEGEDLRARAARWVAGGELAERMTAGGGGGWRGCRPIRSGGARCRRSRWRPATGAIRRSSKSLLRIPGRMRGVSTRRRRLPIWESIRCC
ncbi:hypothetical protein [Chromobacterium sphagni]|uniref:KS-MAT linker domain-containing protein n=1 Tax=Chromobacterium sphagni TaxID=1903179 RepID=UPI003B983903